MNNSWKCADKSYLSPHIPDFFFFFAPYLVYISGLKITFFQNFPGSPVVKTP